MVLRRGAAVALALLFAGGIAVAQDLSPAERAVQDLQTERAEDLERVEDVKLRARAGLSDYALSVGSDPTAEAQVPDDFERTASPLDEDDDGGIPGWLLWPLVAVIAGGSAFLVRRWWRGEDY